MFKKNMKGGNKAHKLGVFVFIILLMSLFMSIFSSINTSGVWSSNYEDWSYRTNITINNTGDNLTNYQILISLNTTNFDYSKANATGNDIRFTNATDNILPYWIEYWNATNISKIWVNVTSINGYGNTTIFMYYGNPNASSESNGTNVFNLFDTDWVGVTTNTSTLWEEYRKSSYDTYGKTVSSGELTLTPESYTSDMISIRSKNMFMDGFEFVFRAKSSFSANAYNRFGSIGQDTTPLTPNGQDWNVGSLRKGYTSYVQGGGAGQYTEVGRVDTDGTYTTLDWGEDFPSDDITQYQIYKTQIFDGNIKYIFNDIILRSNIDTAYQDNMFVLLDSCSHEYGSGAPKTIDYAYVHKYVSPEPTTIVGAEEQRETIHINGNAEFTEANGVSAGNGTIENPYIIENKNINASSTHGIYIENTDAYFIIRNCEVYGSGGINYYGIYFYYVSNSTVDNITSYNNYRGIYLINSNFSNIIANSLFYGNGDCGIFFYYSSNNTVTNCVVNDSNNNIEFAYSSNNTVTNCVSYDGGYGITLSHSYNNNISMNDAYNNGYGIVFSSNNIINTNNIHNNTYGIYIRDSDNSQIYHNNFINNVQNAYDECTNSWDNETLGEGNYWSNYDEPSEGAYDNNTDGIVDTPYPIPGDSNYDYYPFIKISGWIPIPPRIVYPNHVSFPNYQYEYAQIIVNDSNYIQSQINVTYPSGYYQNFTINDDNEAYIYCNETGLYTYQFLVNATNNYWYNGSFTVITNYDYMNYENIITWSWQNIVEFTFYLLIPVLFILLYEWTKDKIYGLCAGVLFIIMSTRYMFFMPITIILGCYIIIIAVMGLWKLRRRDTIV